MYIYEGMDEYLNKLNGHIFSREEIEDIAYLLIDFIEIDDYVSDIIFDVPGIDFGTYNFYTKEIKFSYDNLVQIGDIDYKSSSLTDNRNAFINMTMLQTLFHEILHAMQNYIAFNTDWPLAPLLKLDIVYFDDHTISDEDYDRYHDLFLIEREANITALENILSIIKKHLKDEELYEYFKNRLDGFMIDCYYKDGDTVTSPIEFVYGDLYGLEAPCVHNMDLYDRIKLGFKISVSEYDQFIKDKDNLILAKNNLN